MGDLTVNFNNYGGGGGGGGSPVPSSNSNGSFDYTGSPNLKDATNDVAKLNSGMVILRDTNGQLVQVFDEEKTRLNDLSAGMRNTEKITQEFRRSTLGLSISLFVTTIVIRQMFTSMVNLGKMMGMNKEDSAELTKAVNGLVASYSLVLGPMQMYTMWQMLV
jgi:hypothetical protein